MSDDYVPRRAGDPAPDEYAPRRSAGLSASEYVDYVPARSALTPPPSFAAKQAKHINAAPDWRRRSISATPPPALKRFAEM